MNEAIASRDGKQSHPDQEVHENDETCWHLSIFCPAAGRRMPICYLEDRPGTAITEAGAHEAGAWAAF